MWRLQIYEGGRVSSGIWKESKFCVPPEGRELPDPLQLLMTELHGVSQGLLLLTAQYTQGLAVEVL